MVPEYVYFYACPWRYPLSSTKTSAYWANYCALIGTFNKYNVGGEDVWVGADLGASD